MTYIEAASMLLAKRFYLLYWTVIIAFMFTVSQAAQAQGLQIAYSSSGGIQTLSYNGNTLENAITNPGDLLHIWHMRLTDLQGNVLSGPQLDWGEVNSGKSWNPSTNTSTYSFYWGTIAIQFLQISNSLTINVAVSNLPNSGVIFNGAVVYPLVLSFPRLPAGFTDPSFLQYAFNTTAPSVTLADYGSGEVAAVNPSAVGPLYTGFQPAGTPNSYTPIISGTAPDGLPTFFPVNNRSVAPGQSDNYGVSLRFAPSGTPASALAGDAYQSWAQVYPPVLNWTDRRIIGTAYLASSPSGDPALPGGYPNNPRRYFNDSNGADFDVTTPDGLGRFQARILGQARSNVQNSQQMNAQGVITWDIEGEQYAQPTSYVCEPDQIAQASPEMESIINDPSSPYVGLKLDDAYFRTMRDAGLRVGVCVRPQHFSQNANGTASQTTLAPAQVLAELTRKIQYAHNRWGATLFYLDSTVDATGAPLPADLFAQLAATVPDSLLIPEQSTARDYAYTAPFLTFLFHRDLGTPANVYNYYPRAFSANLINDVDSGTLAQFMPDLVNSVRRGDILMVHADYWQANNPLIMQIYANAAATATH